MLTFAGKNYDSIHDNFTLNQKVETIFYTAFFVPALSKSQVVC